MKISRSAFKGIVKECLVEILSEGIGQTSTGVFVENKNKKMYQQKNSGPPQKNTNNVSQGSFPSVKTGNPILDEVLMDTAKTTLPVMQEAESHKGYIPPVNGSVERIVNDNDPQNLFGEEASSKWAALAFNEMGKKS